MKSQQITANVAPTPLTLPCLIEWDEAVKCFVGHCLTFDLVSTAGTPRAAFDNLKILIKRHVEYSYTHHKAGLKVSADEVEWDRWRDLVNSGKVRRQSVEKVEVNLQEPWDSPAFWADVNFTTDPETNAHEPAANNVLASR